MIELDLRCPIADLQVQCKSDARRLAVFGPSGAGKTTLLHCIAGLIRGEGRVSLDGRELNTPFVPSWRRRVGVLFQDARLFPHLSVRGNIEFAGRIQDDVVEALELSGLLERSVTGLSGGEKRRVALARMLASGPEWLLLDEPLVGLDAPLRARVVALLDHLALPHVVVSHHITEVLRLSEEVLVLRSGRALGQGDFHTLCADPRVFEVAEDLGLENLLHVEVVSDGPLCDVRSGGASLRVPGPARGRAVAIRPEDVILAADVPGRLSARNVLRGEVRALIEVHGRVLVEVDVGTSLRASLTPGAVEDLGLEVGSAVHAIVKATAIRWI